MSTANILPKSEQSNNSPTGGNSPVNKLPRRLILKNLAAGIGLAALPAGLALSPLAAPDELPLPAHLDNPSFTQFNALIERVLALRAYLISTPAPVDAHKLLELHGDAQQGAYDLTDFIMGSEFEEDVMGPAAGGLGAFWAALPRWDRIDAIEDEPAPEPAPARKFELGKPIEFSPDEANNLLNFLTGFGDEVKAQIAATGKVII